MATTKTTRTTKPAGTTRTTKPATTAKSYDGFTEDEREAMKERAKELKAGKGRSPRAKADGEADLLAKIAEMPDEDRVLAEGVHALVKKAAPGLTAKTWYGMPAYARDGKVVVFFQSAAKFKARYATLGFNDAATLDDGDMWPTSFALTTLTPAVEARIAALVEKAAGDA
ncbi:iron chaperone [Streptomyces sp. NPDC012421]|uniref:iron chaperone n=1 Tax=unclassified Streptomyces TaxID=2593676 RepID=UPI00367C5409